MSAPVPYFRSLRLRALLVALISLTLPPALVLGWLAAERGYESGMERNARFSALEARELLLRERKLAAAKADTRGCERWEIIDSEARLREFARGHRVRLQLLDAGGQECFDHDADNYVDLSQRAGSVVLGRPANTAAAMPVNVSPSLLAEAAARGSSTGCSETADKDAVECKTLLKLDQDAFLFVQDSAWRPASILSTLEGPLIRISLIAAPFVFGLAWWMSRRLVLPIEKLRDQVLHKAQEASDVPDLAAASGGEIDDLARSFNTLLATLERRREEETRAAADLVHELKNPLAAIRACGEALQKPHVDPERRAQLAKVLEQSSSRLGALAAQYLELARAEARLPGEERELVDLSALVRGIAASLADDARFTEIDIAVSGPARAPVLGVPHRLESVVRNLLENAASFSPRPGRIEVELRCESSTSLRVSDFGPGISEAELPHVFDRFFSRRPDGSGSGLGLALSRAIVEAHGGTLSAENRPRAGASFVATFAAQAPSQALTSGLSQ